VVLHLDLDSFFVAVERRRQPDLIGRPVVIGGKPGSRGMVAAASREARKCGIRVGMPLAHAAIRCPDGVFLDGAFDACFAASLQVDELLRRVTPDVEWLSIDEAFVGLPGSARPRSAIETAERLHREIAALGFEAACGIARSKLVAKVASRLARPSGVIHVLDGYEARFLSPLKIDMLPGIAPALVMRLRGAGIRRLGQLAKLTDAQVSLLAGRAGHSLTQQAAGIDASRIHRTALPLPRMEEHRIDPPRVGSRRDPGRASPGVRARGPRTAGARRVRGNRDAPGSLRGRAGRFAHRAAGRTGRVGRRAARRRRGAAHAHDGSGAPDPRPRPFVRRPAHGRTFACPFPLPPPPTESLDCASSLVW
jgi:DNA polymerase IV